MSEAAARPAPDLRAVGDKLRAGLARRKAAAPVVQSGPVVAPTPALVVEETMEGIAQEGRTLIQEALEHSGIQRDSVRMVLACHAVMTRLLPAHAKEIGVLVKEAREPMTEAEREAWKTEFMQAVTASLEKLEAVHRGGVEAGVLALRDEARRLIRATDNAAAWRASGIILAALLTGLVLGVMFGWVMFHR